MPSKTNKVKTQIAVIGAGITGCAIARELSRYDLKVIVIEKEADVGWGTSKANTGLVHSGYAGHEGMSRLSLCKKGRDLFIKNAEELSIPIRRTSSLLNGFNDGHLKEFELLIRQGRKYGVPGLEIIFNDDGRLKDIEPNISDNVKAALFCREHFATSPYEAVVALFENSRTNGVDFLLSREVKSIDFNNTDRNFKIKTVNTLPGRFPGVFTASTKVTIVEADYIVNAAGIFSDFIANMIGDNTFSIKAIKGQYFLLDSEVKDLVRMQNILMPDQDNLNSKGMVVGITTGGNHIIGSDYEDTGKNDESTTRTELDEIRKKLSGMINNIPFEKVITTFSGLRAYADTGDFVIGPSIKNNRFINAAGIQSPGLTCAFIIAEIITEHLKEAGVKLISNRDFIPERKPQQKINSKDLLSNNVLYQKDNSFGEIVCRCEKVSEAEIIEAIRRGATTLDGIKFRTRAGMGRCQGGYCTLRILKIMSRELDIPIEELTKSGYGSFMADTGAR